MVIREEVRRVPATASQDFWQVMARCKRREQFNTGGGDWLGSSGGGLPTIPLVTSAAATGNNVQGPALGYSVRGYNPPGLANELVAQALCLPK